VQIEVHDFSLSVLVVEVDSNYESYVTGDVRTCETHDLRLARFHLLRQPWTPPTNASMKRQTTLGEAASSKSPGEGGLPRAMVQSSSYGGQHSSQSYPQPGSTTYIGPDGSKLSERAETVRFALEEGSAFM
jgi:hypothetical protein